MTLLSIPAGVDWAYEFPITVAGQAVDLTGWSAGAQALVNRLFPTDFPPLYEWSTNLDNVTLTDSSITLHVDPATSLAWTWWVGDFIVLLKDPTGRIGFVDEGTVRVEPGVPL